MRDLNRILFLDIETVPQEENTALINHWEHRMLKRAMKEDKSASELWLEEAAFHAEFGKICCISLGILKDGAFIVKSIAGEDEFEILTQFRISLSKANPEALAAFNGHEYDFPYMMRRMLVCGLSIPDILNPFDKKPWQILDNLLDPMKIWSGVQYNHKVSLDLLCYILGIPSPKDEVTGDMIQFLYQAKDFDAIKKYCAGDVVALAKVFAKLMGSQEKFENIQIY